MNYNSSLHEKIEVLKAYAISNSREVLEVHVNLNINPRITEQMFTHKFTFPHALHKNVTILAFSPDSSRDQELKASGADYIANDDIINDIKKGKIFFDYCVASPESMKMISPLAKILGPRGLMPSVKLGTLDSNLVDAIAKLKQGQVSLRNDKFGILHIPIGKLDAPSHFLEDNLSAVLNFVTSKKPASVKGNYVKKSSISSTRGPSLFV